MEAMTLEQVRGEMLQHTGYGNPRAEDADLSRWIAAIDGHLASRDGVAVWGYVGDHELLKVSMGKAAQVLAKPLPELGITTPVYLRAHLAQPAQAMDVGADVEVALSVIDRSIRTLRNAGYPVHADDLLEVRAPVARHLARLVDVERVREAIGYLQSFRNTTPPNWDHTDYAASLLTRALAGEKAEGWRDIATAPKDRTDILATDGTAVLVTYWYGGRVGWLYSYSEHDVAGWHPTHWQPLPTPPTDGEE